MEQRDIRSMTMRELTEVLTLAGEKPYRAKQLFSWLHGKRARSYEEMSDLNKTLRRMLTERFPLVTAGIAGMQVSKTDGTRKYLFAFADGTLVESVFMRYRDWNSVCVSSQAGCAMGCTFCASTLDGLVRNLTASEMLEQVYAIGLDTGERIDRVVVMGMGEPLQNYDNLLRFLALLTDKAGAGLSARHITVSTCGLVPEILRLSQEALKINLAVSLHSAVQEKRERLMPVARMYPLPELMRSCREYFAVTGRQLTFEYALIRGENDTAADAEALSALLSGMTCVVNLIPVNPIRESAYRPPDKTYVPVFKNKLEKCGIHVTIRREMGRDIDGACGQLRRRMSQMRESIFA